LGARAEENLLKLAHLIGQPNADERARWQVLVDNFQRLMKQGGKEADGATRAAQVLADIAQQLQKQNEQSAGTREALTALNSLADIRELLARQPADPRLDVPPALAETFTRMAKAYEDTLLPLVSALHHKMTLDHDIWQQVRAMRSEVDNLMKRIGGGKSSK